MKRSLAPIAIVALLLAGCAATPGADNPVPLPQPIGEGVDLRGEWTLAGATVDGAEVALADFPVTLEFTNGNARVRTGCFSFDQPMTSDLDVVTIGYSQPTASCIGFSEEQTAALESLNRVVDANRDAAALTLFGDGVEYELELVPAVANDAILGTFQLMHVSYGDVLAGFEDGPTITFQSDGTVTGSTGCNEFSGTMAEPVSGTNTIQDLAMTKMACLDPADTDVTAVLEGGFLIHLTDGSLNLVSATSEATLVYDPVS